MDERVNRLGRIGIVLVGLIVAAVAGLAAFRVFSNSLADILGVLLVVATAVVGVRIASRIADGVFPSYNVAEVAVEGPITRDGRGTFPPSPVGTPADDIVEQIERADDDGAVEALLVKLNTPGGEVVPSDDIRRAAREFDGPTIAYATDVCASGGYWIASGCDELWARDASVVGSIGVLGSRINAKELADELGISYERFAAGDYKDAGAAIKEMTDDEREYLQGIIDDFYDRFVERVSESRELEPAEVRDTEARVYLGDEARERGLVDGIGAREDAEDALEDELGEPVHVEAFEPERRLTERLRLGVQATAFAFGAGVASAVVGEREFDFELR